MWECFFDKGSVVYTVVYRTKRENLSKKYSKISRALWILACAVSVLFAPNGANALDFSVHPNNKSATLTAILALGKIEPGDTDKFEAIFSKLPQTKNAAVYLGSPGGNLYEGMRLGAFFSNRRIKTVIEGGYDCASACALAFLGGRDSKGQPWRSSSTNSRLGFHAFRGANSEAAPTDQTQSIVSDILRYGKLVDAPIELLIVNFATPSSDVYWVPNSTLCELGIRLWSVESNRFVCNGR